MKVEINSSFLCNDSIFFCQIQLTKEETEAILHSLIRTSCKGNQLTISMELEDKLAKILNT